MQIREADLGRDVPALVELMREINPVVVTSDAAWLHRHATVPERAGRRLLVAEADGRVVGRVEALLDFFTADGKGICRVAVRASHRRRGIGTTLAAAGLEHLESLGATRIVSDFVETPAGRRFAVRHGFRIERAEVLAVLDPRAAAAAAPPLEAEVRPVAGVDPAIVHRIDETATRDMPFDGTIDEIPFDEWAAHVLDHPLFEAEGSFVAYADGEPGAISLLLADRASARGVTMFTGTLPAFRGRGLGTAAKLATVRWAAAQGLTQLATTNDERNAAMLAVNRRLGYRPCGRRVEFVRRTPAAGTASAPAPPAPGR